ncbi:hypothetical protein TGAM01_v211057 [Trichoderma gamsii]|uniref:Uncharacterized protein n=1 Tax=Trichoderma gamsii TaxID=398673 RepID=A0A2P4Z705_9HYPO|nr:hypothetical protein TGAM01_v211057 [Trichoderma gamsii]PON20076.1 hypothetical protein TGAM01_v211057 [Trichoderma gamsii]
MRAEKPKVTWFNDQSLAKTMFNLTMKTHNMRLALLNEIGGLGLIAQ